MPGKRASFRMREALQGPLVEDDVEVWSAATEPTELPADDSCDV